MRHKNTNAYYVILHLGLCRIMYPYEMIINNSWSHSRSSDRNSSRIAGRIFDRVSWRILIIFSLHVDIYLSAFNVTTHFLVVFSRILEEFRSKFLIGYESLVKNSFHCFLESNLYPLFMFSKDIFTWKKTIGEFLIK